MGLYKPQSDSSKRTNARRVACFRTRSSSWPTHWDQGHHPHKRHADVRRCWVEHFSLIRSWVPPSHTLVSVSQNFDEFETPADPLSFCTRQYNSKLYESEEPIAVDANCILTLRAAGALIFGKTSTTEFATTKQGNWHQNLARNPHDSSRTPGGSSSGSGAAVGDFQVPIALGTQTGGSIIRPASFNGCYGFK